MASGPTHYATAEDFLSRAESAPYGSEQELYLLRAAGVHASLALAAAKALSENGSMPGVDFDAWAKVASANPVPTGRLTVWWLDDGHENASEPRLYTTEAAARDAGVKQYRDDNFGGAREFTWLPVDAEDDEIELAVNGRRTGIIVRPVQPKAAADA